MGSIMMLTNAKVETKHFEIRQQMKRLQAVAQQLHVQVDAITAEAKEDCEQTIQRVVSAKQSVSHILEKDMAVLNSMSHDIMEYSGRIADLTKCNGAHFFHQRSPIKMIQVLQSKNELVRNAEELCSRPIKTDIPVDLETAIPQVFKEKKKILNTHHKLMEAAAVKEKLLISLLKQRKVDKMTNKQLETQVSTLTAALEKAEQDHRKQVEADVLNINKLQTQAEEEIKLWSNLADDLSQQVRELSSYACSYCATPFNVRNASSFCPFNLPSAIGESMLLELAASRQNQGQGQGQSQGQISNASRTQQPLLRPGAENKQDLTFFGAPGSGLHLFTLIQ
jgi:rubrerythrin